MKPAIKLIAANYTSVLVRKHGETKALLRNVRIYPSGCLVGVPSFGNQTVCLLNSGLAGCPSKGEVQAVGNWKKILRRWGAEYGLRLGENAGGIEVIAVQGFSPNRDPNRHVHRVSLASPLVSVLRSDDPFAEMFGPWSKAEAVKSAVYYNLKSGRPQYPSDNTRRQAWKHGVQMEGFL